jgi:hypothetical protein
MHVFTPIDIFSSHVSDQLTLISAEGVICVYLLHSLELSKSIQLNMPFGVFGYHLRPVISMFSLIPIRRICTFTFGFQVEHKYMHIFLHLCFALNINFVYKIKLSFHDLLNCNSWLFWLSGAWKNIFKKCKQRTYFQNKNIV